MVALNNADAFGGQVTLFTEPQNVNTRTGPNGCQEDLKRHRGRIGGRLVRGDSVTAKVGIHAGTAGEVNDHFHV
jgi:hypothetical protein